MAPVLDHARYLRQILLPEVGERGQVALARASAAVGGPTAAHAVATSYARGAGVGAIGEGAVDVAALAPGFVVDAGAREVLAGARAALAAVRAALAASDAAGSGQP